MTYALPRLPFILLFASLGLTAPSWSGSLLLSNNPAISPVENQAIDFYLGAYAGNDMVPVKKLDVEEWPENYRTRSGNNLGVGHFRTEISGIQGHWRVGYFYRVDWLVKGTQDSVEATYLNEKNRLLDQNKTYNLDYTLRGFSADGLRLGYSDVWFSTPRQKIIWGISAALLRGWDVRKEEAQGQLVSIAGVGTLNGNRSYFDTQLEALSANGNSNLNDFIPPVAMEPSNGWGYGLDFGVHWSNASGASLKFAINDLFARISWDRVPLIVQQFDNATYPITDYKPNADGSAKVKGLNNYAPLNFKLDPKYSLQGELPFGNTTLHASVEGINGFWLPQLGLRYALTQKYSIGLDYETRFDGKTLSLFHPNYFVSLSTEDLKMSESRVVGLTTGLRVEF